MTPTAKAGQEEEHAAPSVPRLRVLCIDDDDDILNLLRLALVRTIDAEVTLARSGDEAVGAIAAGLTADVILLDINLGGEEGYEVA
jgi:CheY-like chemotaxis protein